MRQKIKGATLPDTPGVYVLYDDEQVLYVGMAGTQSVAKRWRNHLSNRSGSSALRRSLGPHLGLVERKLSITHDGRYYPADVEQAITDHLHGCELSVYSTETAAEAHQLENEMIEKLDPLLNVRR